MFKQLVVVLLCLVSFAFADENYLVVQSSDFTLQLYDSSHKLLKSYKVGLGKNGMGKTKRGDMKTPLGEYTIIWKASCFFKEDGGYPISSGKGYIGDDNGYYLEKRDWIDDCPLLRGDFGGSDAVFMCLDYPNAEDVAKGHTGSGIAIHATLNGGIGEFSSRGCIRMHPQDARDLYKRIPSGTKVSIVK